MRPGGWLVLVAACGCGRIDFGLLTAIGDAGSGDGSSGDAACAWSAWSAPQRIDVLVSANDDWEPGLSPDGQLLVYTQANMTASSLWLSQRAGAAWGAGTAITALDTSIYDFGPAWTADARNLYFTRNAGSIDRLYASPFDGSSFGTPVALPGLGIVDEASPTVSADELELFYTEFMGTTADWIRRATRASTADAWIDQGRITELNIGAQVGWPTLSQDGLTIYFEVDNLAGVAAAIYVATRAQVGGTFSTPVTVPELDSAGNNGDPEISRDGTTMMFASDRAGTSAWDLWFATRSCL